MGMPTGANRFEVLWVVGVDGVVQSTAGVLGNKQVTAIQGM